MLMKNNPKKSLQPKMRFPEFRDVGDWEEKRLGDVANKTASKITLNGLENNIGIYPVYGASGIIAKIAEYSCDDEHVGIIKDGSGVGRVILCPPKSSIIGTLDSIKANKENFTKFIYYWLTQAPLHLYVIGGAIPHIYFKDYSKIRFERPSIKEQQKIADCLSSLDELIEAEDQKLETLSTYKKGLMQQLFPQAGETTPQLRFPEFRNATEWEPKKIGDEDFASLHKGKGISKADIFKDGETPCIRYGELYTNYGEVIFEVFSKTNCQTSSLFFSKKNDVIIPASGETKIDIATASCLMLDGVALGGDLNVIRSNHNGVFLSYYLNGTLKNKIAKVAQGDSVVHLYLSQLSKLEIFLPKLPEQKRIADFLSSIDDLITSQTKKLESLRLHKKGLMQQLFPNVSEVKE